MQKERLILSRTATIAVAVAQSPHFQPLSMYVGSSLQPTSGEGGGRGDGGGFGGGGGAGGGGGRGGKGGGGGLGSEAQ